ncbi:fumarylacetoacetate hydrolase family protein [Asticcacaulis benevestitus]|uniref:fumarylacetoacetate hydrolase family protein n=1 Tax=Asticcacaulis benevestitus TaxID=347481 RepID=UPI000363AE77|nr:fumarylacetoacetate hydrolase family protein [Asticcacaulis benevestitus]
MKLLRFGPSGSEKPGLLDSDGQIRDLSGIVDDIAGDVLSEASLAKLAAIDPTTLPLAPAGSRYGPCVGRVGKFICIGLNYADHAAESNLPVPSEPVIFTKATSAIIGPNDNVLKPRDSTKLDWEVELGIIIGKTCRYIDAADALSHVAGYVLVNDVSERAFQKERGTQWVKGKGCDTFGPIGPWLVTKDEAGDFNNLHMWLEVNGKRYQNGSSSTMVFKVPQIVAYLSRFMSLQPGDVISTGTPPGVGMGVKPKPVWLNPGDVMELGIEGLGTQKQTVGAA